MSDLRLVVFDVDGTLVDSQGTIVSAMMLAFEQEGLSAPDREDILATVGLSLDHGMRQLVPDLAPSQQAAIAERYKAAFMTQRLQQGTKATSPLYPGIREVLDHLHGQDNVLMGVATGKSKRGMDKLVEGHGLEGYFVTQQVADFHPSKPHPAMLIQAMADTGIEPAQTVMIGDTSFDMNMAKAAGVAAIGVTWGYHDRTRLAAADIILDRHEDLVSSLNELIG